jgi:hypothetical protein
MKKDYNEIMYYCFGIIVTYLLTSYEKASLNPLDWGEARLISFLIGGVVAYILHHIVYNYLKNR